MIITLAGKPGSGKSTVAKLLAAKLGVPYYSMGDLRGKMALERGLNIDELNKLGESEAFTDHEVDDYQKKLGESGEAMIIDGRVSWYFIPQSLKVFLDVEADEGARRIFEARKTGRRDEPAFTSVESTKQIIADRLASDERRYKKYYNVSFLDLKNYDLVIDTTKAGPEEIAAQILNALQAKV